MLFTAPTLDSKGFPVDWAPTALETTNPGYFQVLVDGIDVSAINGVPTSIISYSNADPFDDELAVLTFKNISQFVALPTWLKAGSPVDIIFQEKTGASTFTPTTVFEGLLISIDQNHGQDYDITVHAMGALYQLDLYQELPKRYIKQRDIGQAIRDIFKDSRRKALQVTAPINVVTGFKTNKTGAAESALSGAIRNLLHYAQDNSVQYTLMKSVGRQAVLKTKDNVSVDYEAYFGASYCITKLSVDYSMAANTVYGTGTAEDGCVWMNAKHPSTSDEIPYVPGPYSLGSLLPTFCRTQLRRNGWSVNKTGILTSTDIATIRRMQKAGGLLIDGIIGPQTWQYMFASTPDQDAYYAPVYVLPQAEPFVYSTKGANVGSNPLYDSDMLQVERFEEFGDRVSTAQAAQAAQREVGRDFPAHTIGTIILNAHPGPTNRFLIRSGKNILLKGYLGADVLFHIVSVQCDVQSGQVTLTVDTAGRDFLTLQAVMERAKELRSPLRRAANGRLSSNVDDTKILWDCESGAGIIPRHAVQAKLWSIRKIAAAEYGQIVSSYMAASNISGTSLATKFSWAVFSSSITHTQLAAIGAPTDNNFWRKTANTAIEPLVAWGGTEELVQNLCGYFPGKQTDSAVTLTGVFREEASWDFASVDPPWLWVAIWSDQSAWFEGYIRQAAGQGLLL